MNVVIEDTKPAKPTLQAGDVVVHTTGSINVMTELPSDSRRLVSASLRGSGVTNQDRAMTPSEWLAFWDVNFPGYTIYPASEYELVLRKRGS